MIYLPYQLNKSILISFKTKKGELSLTFSLHFKNIPVRTEYHHQNQLMALEGLL